MQNADTRIQQSVVEVQPKSPDFQGSADVNKPHQQEDQNQEFDVPDDFDEVVFDFGYVN